MKNIKSDRTLLMTSILLFFMLAAGIFSGVMSFIMGHAALKGVTQPDIRPNNTNRADRYNANTKGLELIDEQDLIADVKKQIGQYDPKIDSAEARQQAAKAKKQATAFEKAVKNDPKVDLPGVRVPISVEDQGIVMKVQSINSDKNNFNFGLALVNQGSQSVNFGNNKIEVVNDKFQGISANTIGLPSSLLANGKEIKFNLTIPKNALDKTKKISLKITDVDNKLQLEAAGIAVNTK